MRPMSTARLGADDLAGALLLAPGTAPPHNLRSTRRPLAPRLAPGQAASALPGLLGSLFSLCGQAHRLCSHLALDAAAPGLLPAMPPAQALRRETATEHVRRIGLDWPRLLAQPGPAGAAPALQDLRECPLLATPPGTPVPWAEVRGWLQARWLHVAPATWLRNWQAGGAGWLRVWSQRQGGWLPALVRAARKADMSLALDAGTALRPHGPAGGLRELGECLARQGEDYTAQPLWNGRPAHTGAWSRLHAGAQPGPSSAWALLGSRIAELIRLCLPDESGHGGALWLHWGARPSRPGQGLAWVEMARGLLVHQVRLDGTTDTGVPRVAACQVLAPTEWNFHPEGVAARALARLPRETGEPGPRVRLLMAALDPCVPFRLDGTATRPAPPMEMSHA